MGKFLPGSGFAGKNSVGRFQERKAEAIYGQDTGRGRAHPEEGAGGSGDGSGDRRRESRWDGIFFDVRGQRAEASAFAMGELRFGRGVARTGGRIPEIESAPAGVREFRATTGEVRA